MSSDRSTLRERYRNDLRSGSLPVLLTAVPLAMVVGLGSGWYLNDSTGGFLLLALIGVFVPYVHETHWSGDRHWSRDVAWTLAASAVAGGLFAAGYVLVGTVIADPTHAAAVAFVATVLCGDGLARLLR